MSAISLGADMCRILHIVPTYLPATRYGGPIYSVHGLCKGLARRGHEVHVYTTNVDGPGDSRVPLGVPIDLDGVRVSYFPTGCGRRLYRSPAMQASFDSTLAGFDVIHLHSAFLWPTAAGAASARRARVPYVVSPRGMLVPELIAHKSRLLKNAWISIFERRNLAEAAAVHVTSEIEKTDIERLGLKARRFAMIPNGVEMLLAGIGPTAASMTAQPTVFFLGRINWKKGLDRLIPAMVHVPDAQLVIAGNDEEGYTRELLALAAHHGVATRTHFVGPLHGMAKWEALAAADIVALPSYSENFGIVVLEAMASGVPVIVTPEVGLARTVKEAGAGLVVEGRSELIGSAIKQLLDNPDQRCVMGEAGRVAAKRHFSWEAIATQMEGLYLDLARPTGARQLTHV